MPEPLLTILKFCFLAVLYLFFARVVRAVWAELTGSTPVVAPASVAERPSRSAGGGGGGKPPGRLKVVEPAERRGKVYELGDELTVGRAGGCQVTLEDNYVSQLHARVFRRDGQFFVEDLGSTNGTFVNQKKVTAPIAIRRGDRLQVGKTVLELT
jgi:pSer/pThr/pTyr-binding forkhead associated (FHA) protein